MVVLLKFSIERYTCIVFTVELHSYSEHRKTTCDDLSLHHDSRRNLQGNVGKIPYILYSDSHELVCDLLGGCTRNADNCNFRR